ncbi:hypothetical protein SAMN05428989_3612 [Pseudoxanthomonas sp. GM95]|uniref:hypothetical protein n=1 Tax=Pseudoxanthomonas sp. GM95 TaxID=1881043 RepID=UPI0008D7244B|nr:hypothetical protein [Pseudoxanthomonas sp. GM95]SEM35273.1 hypothetical protein SAMN05428989_3612 [Pseudoxanthomonas sp. GM95]
MIRPATLRQRLILASAVAFVLNFALQFISTRLLPAPWQLLTLHDNSFVSPVACVLVAISLCAGGWIGGRRFLPIGVALVLLLQVVSLLVLTQIAHGAMPRRDLSLILSSVLASNALGFGLQLLAAAIGALAGASLSRRRPLFPLPP